MYARHCAARVASVSVTRSLYGERQLFYALCASLDALFGGALLVFCAT